MIYIGIVGSRYRDREEDYNAVVKRFRTVMVTAGIMEMDMKNVTIVSGGCSRGADRFAEIIADNFGLKKIVYRPQWREHGKKAGLLRNVLIAEQSDILIACVSKNRQGGTGHTIAEFTRRKGNRNLHIVELVQWHKRNCSCRPYQHCNHRKDIEDDEDMTGMMESV